MSLPDTPRAALLLLKKEGNTPLLLMSCVMESPSERQGGWQRAQAAGAECEQADMPGGGGFGWAAGAAAAARFVHRLTQQEVKLLFGLLHHLLVLPSLFDRERLPRPWPG